MMNRVNHLKNHKIYTKAPNRGALYLLFVILNGLLFKSINSVAINEGLLSIENEI